MYGCESWTIKKAEHQRIDAFELWSWRRLLKVSWTSRRSNQSILKEISSVQLLSRVRLFATPWTAAHQASLSITISLSFLKVMSIELVMPSNHLILCHPLLLPSIFPSFRVFSNESVLISSQSIGASTSVLPMNIQDWFSLGLTGLISLQSRDSQESSLAQLKSINSSVLSLLYGPVLTSTDDYWKNHSFD